jgi:flagellar basal-body rod modification protein FlgD
VRIQVVDVAGRIVRRAELPAQGAPERVWMWDGRDDRGAPVPSGRYRARAWDESGGTSRPFVIVR